MNTLILITIATIFLCVVINDLGRFTTKVAKIAALTLFGVSLTLAVVFLLA